MTFPDNFTNKDKIELLERSILVNSIAYYDLDGNLLSDYQYDMNAMQLASLKRESPEDFKSSRYYEYFHDYCSEDDNQHYTSGFDLLRKVEKKDPTLYRHLRIDATLALDLKEKHRG